MTTTSPATAFRDTVPPPATPGTAQHATVAEINARRLWQAVRDANNAGHADGFRTGYVKGWRWGLACGAVLGSILALAAIALGIASGWPKA